MGTKKWRKEIIMEQLDIADETLVQHALKK